MHKSEDFHHTPEQLHHALDQAEALLDGRALADIERAHLLSTLVTLLSSKQIFYEQVGPIPNLALPGHARH